MVAECKPAESLVDGLTIGMDTHFEDSGRLSQEHSHTQDGSRHSCFCIQAVTETQIGKHPISTAHTGEIHSWNRAMGESDLLRRLAG